MNIEINNRYLLNKKSKRETKVKIPIRPEEHFILEISDTKKFFKSRRIDNSINWENVEDYEVLERLNKI